MLSVYPAYIYVLLVVNHWNRCKKLRAEDIARRICVYTLPICKCMCGQIINIHVLQDINAHIAIKSHFWGKNYTAIFLTKNYE